MKQPVFIFEVKSLWNVFHSIYILLEIIFIKYFNFLKQDLDICNCCTEVTLKKRLHYRINLCNQLILLKTYT